MIDDKELGKLSIDQFRRFNDLYNVAKSQKDLFGLIRKERSDKYKSLLKNLIPWSVFYELPTVHFYALYLHLVGLPDLLSSFGQTEDPIEAAISYMESDLDLPAEIDDFTIEEYGILFSMSMATAKDIEACQLFNMHMHDLIERAKEDDEALFDAVLVDRSVINCPTIAKQVAEAEADNDEDFFELLSKAIKKTRPRRPKEELDDLRFALVTLEQAGALAKLSYIELHDLLMDDLKLIPEGLDDSVGSLKKFIQRRNKVVGDMKT